MTRANKWLAFSGVLSVGAGFLGGMMFSRRGAPSCPAKYTAYGNIYYVGDDTYFDGTAVEYLTVRADWLTSDEDWTVLRFRTRLLYIKKFHDGLVFPGQRGAAYVRRRPTTDPSQAQYDKATSAMLGDLGGFHVLESHHWPSWNVLKEESRAGPQGAGALSPEKRKQ